MATVYEVGLKWTGGADASAAVRAADRVDAALGALEAPRRVSASSARRVADEWQRMAARAAKEDQAERIRGAQAFARAENEKRNAAFRRLQAQQRDEERFARYRIALDRRVAREQSRAAAQAAKEREARYRGYGRTAGGIGAAVGGVAAGGIKGTIAAVGAAALYGGKQALDTAQLVENARMRLKVQLGSTEAANTEIRDAFRIAEKTIFDPEQVLDALTKLSTNFKNADVRRYVMGAVSDFATASGEGSEGLERSIKAINQIFAKGKLQQEELTGQLGELGLPAKQVYEQLATMLGIKDADEQKRTDKVIKLITKGGVSAEAGIQAITTVMRNLAGGGPAGEFAVKSADTISGMISNIEGGFKTLFATSEIDQWPALLSMKDLLRDIAGFFSVDSAAGKSFISSLQKGIAKDLVPVVERFHRAWNAITGDPTKMEMIVRGVTRITSWLFDAAYAAGLVGTAFVAMWGIFATLDETIMGLVDGALTAIGEGTRKIGEFIMVGLADGIRSGAGAVYDAVAGVGANILQSLRSKLGIASPSKRGMELGAFYSQGVALGIDQGSGAVQQASAALGGAAESGFRPLAALGSGRGGAGSAGASIVVHQSLAVTLPNVADPAEFAAAVGPLAFPRLARDLHAVLGRQLAAGVG